MYKISIGTEVWISGPATDGIDTVWSDEVVDIKHVNDEPEIIYECKHIAFDDTDVGFIVFLSREEAQKDYDYQRTCKGRIWFGD